MAEVFVITITEIVLYPAEVHVPIEYIKIMVLRTCNVHLHIYILINFL